MTTPHPLVLASASPRRRALLEGAGLNFEVRPADLPEERQPGEKPEDFAVRLAGEKARAGADGLGPGRFVLGADTIVVLDTDVLGKPRDPEHAVALLARLVGRSHEVITGVAVVDTSTERLRVTRVSSRVEMRAANGQEVRSYIATGESLDKAGAYALQGQGRRFVRSVRGSETNVIGLPVEETLELLRAAGWRPGP
jgi:septum formation protein